MNKRYKNIINTRFGKLIVIEETGRDKHHNVIWRCECDCGNVVNISTTALNIGHTTSCGCLHKEQLSIRSKSNLIGQKFGLLTVLKENGRNKKKNVLWECSCGCGLVKTTTSYLLNSGKVKSCGCLTRRKGKDNPQYNHNRTDEDRVLKRQYPEYSEWRNAVFLRDKFKCQSCMEDSASNLNAHHIENYSSNIKKRILLDNGITMCEECHRNFHHNYSKINNNKEQILEFLNWKRKK